MNNNSGRQFTDQPGISGDGIILLVFLFIGGVLFAAFMLGSVFNNSAGIGSANLPTTTHLAPQLITARSNVTGTITPSAIVTPLAPGIASMTPLRFKTFTPKPVIFYPTSSYYSYKPSPIPLKTLTPTRTVTRTVTATVTPSVTATATRTGTLTSSQTATASITLTATTTMTLSPTNTATPTPTATPAALTCLSPAPSGQIPLLDTWIDSSVLPTPTPPPSHGADIILNISASGTHSQRGLFQFSAPSSSSFTSASLHIFVTSQAQDVLVAYRLTREFNNDANWLDAQPGTSPWVNAGGDISIISFSSYQLPTGIPQGGCWVSLDVAALIQDWVNNPTASLGIILLPGADLTSITISSMEGLNSPLLEIK